MEYTVCFYQYSQKAFFQYPLCDGIETIAVPIIRKVSELRGKHQLILKRSGDNGNYTFIFYNYTFNESKDSFGICWLLQAYYPQNVNHLFSIFGETLSDIIREGKILYFDKYGRIKTGNKKLYVYGALLDVHLNKLLSRFEKDKFCFLAFSTNYFKIYQNKTGIYQLSDNSWNISEAFKTNNIIIITKEIEDENINGMRSFIIKSNETIDDLNKKIKELEKQLKKVEREKKKQPQMNSPKKQGNNTNESGTDATTWIVLGVIVAIILLNLIAPWFISSVWSKLAVIFTSLGTYLAIKALKDDTSNKTTEILGWSGVIAILLSTVLTIYGLCGGFSPETVDEGGNVQTVTERKNVPESEQGNITSIPTPVTRIPNNFVHVSSGASDFYIDKYEVTQKDYASLMGNNPSKYQGDSLPVHGMSVRDAVIYCNKKSDAEGLRGFYDISGNVVKLKDEGNGYRLPTEEEWMLASKKTKDNHSDKSFSIRPYPQDVKRYDFKPHIAGGIQDKRRELFDVYGNVSELCVRSNGEIWGKGGSYRIALDSETSEDGGLKAAENLSSTIHLNADFGLRLVFIP